MIRNTKMQNLFRVQPSCKDSLDFLPQTYYYIFALEPDFKAAISSGLNDKGARQTVKNCNRGFRMLTAALEVFKLL